MSKPECRPGTYPTNGELIKKLRRERGYKSEEEFCAAPPPFAKPTLDRAEASGCSFKATLEKIAKKLALTSWRELVITTDIEPEPTFTQPTNWSMTVQQPWATFDETKDGCEVLDKIQLLLDRKIPFLVLAFSPSNSVRIDIRLESRDAVEIAVLHDKGALRSLGIEAFNMFLSLELPRRIGFMEHDVGPEIFAAQHDLNLHDEYITIKSSPPAFPPVSVTPTEDGLLVELQIPGVRPDELEVSLGDNVLVIAGVGDTPDDFTPGEVLVRERVSGHFHRTIALPFNVGVCEANLKDDLLQITLSKAAETAKPSNETPGTFRSVNISFF